MIDFSKLQTPRGDGATLVEPAPPQWHPAALANHRSLGRADHMLLGKPLAVWRARTRKAMGHTDDELIVVTGHQPEFIHPGVWAKHIVAQRFAVAIGGSAINLIVDSDVVKQSTLLVPVIRDESISLERVPVFSASAGQAYEQLATLSSGQVAAFRRRLEEAMGRRFESSAMPRFLDELAMAANSKDWVDQSVTARQATERDFGVSLTERRLSGLWFAPMLADMLVNAESFGESYNRALADYRSRHHVRGVGRPIPDLVRDADRCEVPFWAVRGGQPRRRVLVAHRGHELHLYADDQAIGVVSTSGLADRVDAGFAWDELDGWQLRPRALTLTIWARLMLADLFIHGIGGAKYDRISDRIIGDYYRTQPPHMACVSATLWAHPTRNGATVDRLRDERRTLRDVRYNPQRHFQIDDDLQPLFARRAALVKRSDQLRQDDPRNRAARREAFAGIREASSAVLELRHEAISKRRSALKGLTQELSRQAIAEGREYFFALYARKHLEALTGALPASSDFRV